VETREAFTRELEHDPPDLILSDHGLPCFDGFTALAIAREKCPYVPFIFVASSLGEQVAIETFESGATDYVLKSSLNRLVPAVQRALREAAERIQHKQAEDALRSSEARKRAILDTALDAVISISHDGRVEEWNLAAQRLFGYTPNEALGHELAELIIPPSVRTAFREGLSRCVATGESRWLGERIERTALKRDGTEFSVEVSVVKVPGSKPPVFTGFLHDITQRKQSEEALRNSESLKRVILDTALDAILSIDEHGLVEEWNSAAERIFGYSRQAAMGRPIDELIIPTALRESYQDGLANYLITGVGSLLNRPIELTLRRADGIEFGAELAITRHSFEEPSRCTVLIRDISELKQAESALRDSEERFRLMVESVEDYAIYMLDAQGRVTTWNPGAERIEGYRAEEVLGKHLSTFFTPEDVQAGRPEQSLRRATAEGRALNEGWRVRKDGTRFWSVGILTALRDETGRLRGFAKVAHDMTARKRGEEVVQRLNAELEHRVRERTAQLEAANQELEAFSYSVSHDLRAPLRHIVGYADMLQHEAADLLDEHAKADLNVISDAARQMGNLIDALLAFSRMGRSEMREQTVRLARLVEEARRELRREMEGRRIEWNIHELPEVRGDPLMLRLAVINLLSNAMKYTRTRPVTKIEIGATCNGEEVVFFIRDNGVGFDMRYVDKLFGVFQRLHGASEFEGTGIGLANVRRIIHRHNGRTWGEGVIGQGATFYFSLPRAAGEPTEQNNEHKMDPAG
jgi:PAS domain S-box-containing protein